MKIELLNNVTLFQGDCRETLRSLPDNSVDAVPCDPPYALVSIVKRFGNPNAAPAKGNDAYARASAGFMGKTWDTGEVAFDPEFWREVYRVLKPGGHLAAFSASRTYHRMACAIEDAGFEIRDSLMWIYGTGFPKSQNVSAFIDKSDPASPAVQEFDGFGTALKPAFEPIVLARKPLSEPTVAANVLKWRTGALNIDGCRVNSGPVEKHIRTSTITGANSMSGVSTGSTGSGEFVEGRWPANVVTDGSDEVAGLFPNSSARFFYSAKASKADRAGSKHPTVKPIALMQWLAKLITPPGGTVLDPFAGSGTTGAAAVAEGFSAILCERESEYVADIKRRIGEPLTNNEPAKESFPWE